MPCAKRTGQGKVILFTQVKVNSRSLIHSPSNETEAGRVGHAFDETRSLLRTVFVDREDQYWLIRVLDENSAGCHVNERVETRPVTIDNRRKNNLYREVHATPSIPGPHVD